MMSSLQTAELPLPAVIPPVFAGTPDLSRGKNIVICADGTGNADVKGRGSNVFKLFEAVDTTSHLHDLSLPRQVAFYDEGVGTESWLPLRVVGAGFGVGLKHNICELYREIARVYQEGDRLYLFGFSRGGFTVRMLAGMIDCCGMLHGATYTTRAALQAQVRRCFDHYVHGRTPEVFPPDLVRFEHAPIEFVGAWDTVDAVGFSFNRVADWWNEHVVRYKRDVNEIPASVRYACQALALDEQRKAFSPELWRRSDKVEQVWFAGVHSDIGGGYPRQGLSLIPLHWMMRRAEARGLRFVASEMTYYDEHQILSDKLHNSRAGVATLYRWKPRDVAGACAAAQIEPQVHISTFDRLAQGVDGYSPINLPANPVINFTERRDWRYIDPSQLTAALATHASGLTQTGASAARAISVGIASYWIAVTGIIVALLGLLFISPLVTGAGFLVVVLASRLASRIDRQLDRTFSLFWHRVRKDLRSALTRQDPAAASFNAIPTGVAVAVERVCSPPY